MKNVGMSKAKVRLVFLAVMALGLFGGCSDTKDLIELALDGPDRKTIDTSRLGVNNFFVDSEFGSISDQYLEIRDVLGIKSIRLLFAWTTAVQPSPNVAPNYSFFDNIIAALPPGIDVIIVLSHTPDWMFDPSNWINGNPRQTWAERWVRPTVTRYANTPGILGWEIFNEQDVVTVASDVVLEITEPANYIELLAFSSNVIRNVDPARLVILGATRSIQQNFPTTLDYNKDMQDLGAEAFIDVWNIHYYGKRFESVITSSGVKDFLNAISKNIWITESGEQGPNSQLGYVEEVWPFLRSKIGGIDRIYYFEYGSTVPIEQNFGLRTTNAEFPVSDLYVHLRERAAGG